MKKLLFLLVLLPGLAHADLFGGQGPGTGLPSASIPGGLVINNPTITSSSYTETSTDVVIYANALLNNLTITLSSASAKQQTTVVKSDVSSNTVNVQTNFSTDKLVGGSTFYVLNAKGQTLTTLGIGANTLLKLVEQNTPSYNGPVIIQNNGFVVAASSQVSCAAFYTTVPTFELGARMNITTAANGFMDWGVYSSSGGLIMNSTGAFRTDGLSAGTYTLTYLSGIPLPPGQYYRCNTVSNQLLQLGGVQASAGTNPFCFSQGGTTSNLPQTITLPGSLGTKCFAGFGVVAGGSP